MNTNIDFNDYQDPIQNYLHDNIYWEYKWGMWQKTNVRLQSNKGTFQDDLIQVLPAS